MELVVINKKNLRKNKALKMAQKEAKKFFGRTRGYAPKAKINKFISVKEKAFVSMIEEKECEINKYEPDKLTYKQMIVILRNSKLTGLSGNGFLVADKIEAFHNANTENRILLINSVECDPGLIHDEWILENKLNLVIKGIQILDGLLHFHKKVIATKENISSEDCFIEIKKVPNRYPMGAEKILIKNCFDIEVEPDELPVQRGILVMNIQTVMMLGTIIMSGEKFNSRYLTVANLINGNAMVVRANIGADAKSVIHKCIPENENKTIYIGGGSMSCHELQGNETIAATTNFIAYAQRPEYELAGNCKGCGACSAACPMKIKVHKIVRSLEKGQLTRLELYHPERCIQCGACTYVCHAGKDTRELIKKIISK